MRMCQMLLLRCCLTEFMQKMTSIHGNTHTMWKPAQRWHIPSTLCVSVSLGMCTPNTTRGVCLRLILNSISDVLNCGGTDYCIETRAAGSCKKSPQNQGRFLYPVLDHANRRSLQFLLQLCMKPGRELGGGIWLVLLTLKAPYSLMWLHSSCRKPLLWLTN